MSTASIPGVEAVRDLIEECELAYREPLAVAIKTGMPWEQEEEFLGKLDRYLPDVVAVFDEKVPPPRQRGGGLALEELYRQWEDTSGDADVRRHELIRSFIAVETERQGMFRLHRIQNVRVAAHYEAIGAEFEKIGLNAHAATAFQRAADIYLVLQDAMKRDMALLKVRRARHRVRPAGIVKFVEKASDLACGYGYRPYLLLTWMLAVLATFSVLVWWFSSDDLGKAVHSSLINFLNPIGLDEPSSGTAQTLLVVESYIGSVSMSVFFALLVRRWFAA